MKGKKPHQLFGANVITAQEFRGLTGRLVASRAKVSPEHYSTIRNGHGEQGPSLNNCHAIAKALGFPLDQLCLPPAKFKKEINGKSH